MSASLEFDPTPSSGPARPEAGPVYAVLACTWFFLNVIGGFITVAIIVAPRIASGELTAEGVAADLEAVVGLKSPAFLFTSVAVSSGSMLVVGLAASAWRRGAVRLTERLALTRFSPLDAAVAAMGTLGVGSALDAIVYFSGLRGFGSLGFLREMIGGLSGPALWGTALLIGALPGIAEEVLFRGFALRKLAFAEGPKLALIVSSVAFGLFHADPVHAPSAMVIGFYLGAIALMTRSLWPVMLAHAVNNAAATFLVGLPETAATQGAFLGLGLVSGVGAYRFLRHRHGAPLDAEVRPW